MDQVCLICQAVRDGDAEQVAKVAAASAPHARHAGLLVAALDGSAALVVRALLDSGARPDAQLGHCYSSILGPLTHHSFVEIVSKFFPANFERALLKWVLPPTGG